MIKNWLYTLLVLFIFLPFSVFSQYGSEAELKKEAERLFAAGSYTEAMPLFGQLTSLYPKDANYNYKYGACLIYGDRDKEKPLRFLRFAVSKPDVDPQAFYFMGKALHLNYYFKEAIENYSKFIAKVPAKARTQFDAEREIEMCRNGVKLLSDIKDIDVVSRKETGKEEFYRVYDLKSIGGKIIVKPDEFKSKYDKKMKDYSVIYLPADLKNEVYFAGYNEDGKGGKDIFKVLRLPNGDWGKPVNIGAPVNTNFDEDFPFMHPDGKTLFFSSKGHNSMGGYDIFKTVYDERTSTWSQPQNLDFAYSSPDDDFFFVTDKDMTLAYFASSRGSKEGNITVYRVKVQPKSADFVIIKGEFINEDNAQMRTAKITVTDLTNNQNMGDYFTNAQSGKYAILLPGKGGKYKFTVETTESAPIHSGQVEVPRQEAEVVALKQEIRLIGKGDNEKLIIKNLFDQTEPFDISDPLLVESIIRQKAKLEVNTTEAQVLAAAEKITASKVEEVKPAKEAEPVAYKSVSNEAIAAQSKQLEEDVKKHIDKLQNEANYAHSVANGKSVQAKDNADKADKIMASLSQYSATDRSTKENEASLLKKEAATLTNEAKAARKIAAALENDLSELRTEFTKISQLTSAIQYDISSNNRSSAIEKFEKQKSLLASINETPTSKTIEREAMAEKAASTRKKADDTARELHEIEERENELNNEIRSIEAQMQTAKKKDKEQLEARLKAAQMDKEDISFQRESKQQQLEGLQREAAIQENEFALYDKIDTKVIENKEMVKAPSPEQIKQTETTLARLEEKGVTKEEKGTSVSTSSFDMLSLRSKYDIIDENGKIVNYNNTYSAELAAADKISDTDKRADEISRINDNWAKAIQQEIDIEQERLKSTQTLNDKTAVTARINTLKNLKEQKDKDAKQASSSSLASFKPKETHTPSEILDGNGNIIDYEKTYTADLSKAESISDQTEKERKKREVYKAWNNAIQQEITLQKLELSEADTEQEKELAQKRINELEIQLASNNKEINASSDRLLVFQQNKQSASSSEPSTPVRIEDNATNFSFNKSVSYSNQAATASLENTTTLNKTLRSKREELLQLENQIETTSNPEERNRLLDKTDKLEMEAKELELQIAESYAIANTQQYNANAVAIQSPSFKQAVSRSDDGMMAEMLNDEANFYFNEAAKIRQEVNPNMAFTAKQTAIQRAYDYEAKALEKQQQALSIAKYESIVVRENETLASEITQNTRSIVQQPSTQQSLVQNAATNTQNESTSISQTTSPTDLENEASIKENTIVQPEKSLPKIKPFTTTAENKQAERLIKEAEILEAQANEKNLQAENTRKKKEKEALVQDVNRLRAEASEKRQEADELTEVHEQKIETQNELIAAKEMSARKVNAASTVSSQESSLAQGLSDSELSRITAGGAYNSFAENKNKARRLNKEADVEYTEALALASAANADLLKADELRIEASTEVNEEKMQRLEKEAEVLEQRAAENERKSTQLKESALKKEKEAIFYENQAQFALTDLSPEQADKIEAVEKTATANTSFKSRLEKIAEVQTSTLASSPTPINTQTATNNVTSTTTSNTTTTTASNANLTNNNTSASSTTNNQASTSNTGNNTTSSATSSASPAPNSLAQLRTMKIPEKLTSNIFLKISPGQSAYNNTNPIPVSEIEPEGLVFKVQVGAFRNPIPQDHFKGFAPILSESGPNNITRYTAGYFKDFSVADNAKNDIRGLGYSDAFVVAFLNGKRINIDQARAMASGGASAAGSETSSTTSSSSQTNASSSNASSSNTAANTSTSNTSMNTSANSTLERTTNVQSIKGVFYTVQVGVYASTIKPEVLNSVSNVNSDRLPDGLVRYSSGRYNTPEEAATARTGIIAQGISDAFVTAYINGERYTVSQARRIIEQQGIQPSSASNQPTANNTSTTTTTTNTNTNTSSPNNTSSSTSSNTSSKEAVETDMEYKVNLGEFTDEIPNDIAEKYLQLSTRGIRSLEKGNKTVYLIGSFNNFEDAEKMRREMNEMGIPNTRIVGFKQNEIIELR